MSDNLHRPAFYCPEGTDPADAGLTKLEYAAIKIASESGPISANPQAVARQVVELARAVLGECDETV